MNKSNKKVFDLSEDYESILPVIGEEIRFGDTLIIQSVESLGMTIKQSVEYLLLLENEGIDFKSIREPYLNSEYKGSQFLNGLKVLDEASKRTLSKNSSIIKGSGAKLGSYNVGKEREILGMYGFTKNISLISKELEVSRNTIYKTLKRNNLK